LFAALILAYVASLLLMGALWANYFEALLPALIMAWIKAGRQGRLGLSLSYLLLWIGGFAWPPLETTGMILIIIIILKTFWAVPVGEIATAEVSPTLQKAAAN
jgi:hypothetical protein